MRRDDDKRNRSVFLVLLSLAHGPMHGYEISKFIQTKTRGFFRLPFGSLYPVLHRLEKEKLIASKWSLSGVAKQRKTYSITAKGRKALKEEMELFKGLSGAIKLLSPRTEGTRPST